jgi:aryl-alcohol dehydrogenase-like predicted oxidoreductase
MEKRKLGKSGLAVPPLMLGGNVFGWTADEQTSFRLLDGALDSGLNAIDTSDAYSRWVPGHKGGESETVLGKWFAQGGKREKVVLATKVGLEMGPGQKGLRKKRIFEAVDESLQRLQTDYIDLYQSHRPDAETPIEQTLEAYAELIKLGKVRAIGASNYTAEQIDEAMAMSSEKKLPRYESLQPEYNLYERKDYEQNLRPTVEKHGIGVIPYFALAAGFLTGKYRSKDDLAGASRAKMVEKYLDERGRKILQALDAVVKRTGAKPAEISLAWLMAQPSVTAPIASATSVEQLKHLIAATQLKLSPENLAELDRASAY